MNLYSLTISIIISTILIACGNSGRNAGEQQENLDITVEQLSSEIDPVCGMSVANQAIADSAHYKGKIYGFCNPGCKEAFKEDPESYLAKAE